MGDKERIAELETQLAALSGEVERLKGMDDAMIRLALCHDIKDALVKERDTLRAGFLGNPPKYVMWHEFESMRSEVSALKATGNQCEEECDTLRATLHEIANMPSPECARDPFLCKALARGALADKPRFTDGHGNSLDHLVDEKP